MGPIPILLTNLEDGSQKHFACISDAARFAKVSHDNVGRRLQEMEAYVIRNWKFERDKTADRIKHKNVKYAQTIRYNVLTGEKTVFPTAKDAAEASDVTYVAVRNQIIGRHKGTHTGYIFRLAEEFAYES